MKNNKVAILIDGSFFLKRYYSLINRERNHSPEKVAKHLYTMAHSYVGKENQLYRIFYYDCIPSDKRVHHPLTNKCINFSKTDQHNFRIQFFEELKKKRKVALRLGYLRDSGNWIINPKHTKNLIGKDINISDLKEEDFTYEFRQKGIDFILDPMWNPIDDFLFEHIDGLKSTCRKIISEK